MNVARVSLVVVAVFVAGESNAPASQGASSPPPVTKGIAVADVDRASDACTDFYAFANGSWRTANPIPPGTQRWSRRYAAREANRRYVTNLLEELAARREPPRGSLDQQLGDHYAACMNEPALDAAGVTPVAPLLTEIDRVQDAAGVQRMIRRLHDLAIPAAFTVTAASDYNDPDAVVMNIAPGGLGLPGRDHYVKTEPEFAEARTKYRAYVARVLELSGIPSSAAETTAGEIVALETRFAEASLPPAAASDPATTAHRTTFIQLKALAPRVDWDGYATETRLPRVDVNVAEPAYLQRLNRELETTPVTTWKAYLTWRVLDSAAPWLSKPFVDESFAFKDAYLGGATTMTPRATRCLDSTEALLGEALGRRYAERTFPPAAKAKVQEMVRELLEVLKDDLRENKWMSVEMKKGALAKVATYDVKVGYPDTWTDYSSLAIRRDALWNNIAAARRFNVAAERKRIGTRASRSPWLLPPSSPDAYIDVQLNLMALPAGFLQAPAFDLNASDAVNYGAIGVGVAHDITHAIDVLGRDFDAKGQPRNWWTQPDLEAFQKVGQCTVDQYEAYEIAPGVHHEGKRVLGEALGDLAGVRLAYRALQRSMQRRPVAVIDGFTPEQQFFISWGQYRGAAESPELQRRMMTTDSHPTAKYRVIGPLANTPEFHGAFACRDGSSMARPAEKRCSAW
jgi:endothelin-converting enzyme/putative endopeptidase